MMLALARREHRLRLLNLAYVSAAVAGLVRWREFYGLGLFVLFLFLPRSSSELWKTGAPL